MSLKDYIIEYNDALVGWTVVSVNEPTLIEGLCEIVLLHPSNGKRRTVALGANDLGAWVDFVKDSDGYFMTFEQLANAASCHASEAQLHQESDDPYTFARDPKNDSILVVSACDGTEWRIEVSSIEEKWRWVLDPDSPNDPACWFDGFAGYMTEEGLVFGLPDDKK